MARRKGGRSLGLPHFTADAASEICRRTLMQILPGAAENDLEAFGDGVTRVQEIVGDHFASAQGGGRFTSAPVGRVAARLKALGAHGIGQSRGGRPASPSHPTPTMRNFSLDAPAPKTKSGVEIRSLQRAGSRRRDPHGRGRAIQ